MTRRVDGLVIMPASERQDYLVASCAPARRPSSSTAAPRGVDADSVTVDNLRGAGWRPSTCSRRATAGSPRSSTCETIPTAARRLAGFTDAYAERGLRPDPRLVVTGLRSTDEATEVMHAPARPRRPADRGLRRAQHPLHRGGPGPRRAGLRREVALVGFDDFPLADLLDPPLTVIRQDVARIGKTVADLLFDRIDGNTLAAAARRSRAHARRAGLGRDPATRSS